MKLGSNLMISAEYVKNGKNIVLDSCESKAVMIAFTTVTGSREGTKNRYKTLSGNTAVEKRGVRT